MENCTEGSWTGEQISFQMQYNEENAALDNMQYCRTCSITEHVVVQNMQYYRTCSSAEYAVLQNMQY